MERSLNSFMKVGIVHFMAYPETQRQERVLETLAELAADEFFGAVEVTHIADPATRKAAAALLQTAGLTVGYGAQIVLLGGKLDLNSSDKAARQAAIDRCKAAVDEAYELGASRFAVLSGPDPGEAQRAAAIELLADSLVQVCRYARERGGMPVCLETFDRDIDKKRLIGSNADGVRLSQLVRQSEPSFGLMLDLSHIPLQHETTDGALGVAREHLVHAHMGNCIMRDKSHPLYGDNHPYFGHPAGENGVPELTGYLRKLIDIGYLKPGMAEPNIVAFEVKPAPGESAQAVIANAKRTLLQAWAAV